MRATYLPSVLLLAGVWAGLSLALEENARGQGIRALPKKQVSEPTVEERIDQALRTPVKLKLIETPLKDVLEHLQDSVEVPIVGDWRAIDIVGIGQDTPISQETEGISLAATLKLMLKDLDMNYTIYGEVLLVTTKEEAETIRTTKIYEVTDLVKVRSAAPSLVYSQVFRPRSGPDFDSLIELITTTVDPHSWDEVGGPGSIDGTELGGKNALVVSQTYERHRKVEAFLSKLRTVKAQHTEEQDTRKTDDKSDEIVTRVYPITGSKPVDVDELVELLREATGEACWEAPGAKLLGKANAILVKNRADVHSHVEELLWGLGAFKSYGGGGFGSSQPGADGG